MRGLTFRCGDNLYGWPEPAACCGLCTAGTGTGIDDREGELMDPGGEGRAPLEALSNCPVGYAVPVGLGIHRVARRSISTRPTSTTTATAVTTKRAA